MKDEKKEILDRLLKYLKESNINGFGYEQDKLIAYEEAQVLLDYIINLQDRIKELEQINEEHRKLNGELRKTINEAIEYIKEDMYAEPKELYGLVDGEHLLNILQNDEVK